MENEKQPSPEKPGVQFEKRVVETPIFDTALKQKIASSSEDTPGLKGFYRANKFYFWAIFAGVIIIGLLGYYAFRKPAQVAPQEANVSINVDVPETVASGSEAVYKIITQNNDTQKLIGMELELTYAEGVAFESSSPEPENLSGTIFKIPDLIPGQNAVVFVKTKVTGNVNDQKNINIKLHYKYSNFNSEFVKEKSAGITLIASDVLVEIQGPSSANNGQIVLYTVKYQNNSDNDVKNARIKLDYPVGFVFASAQPAADIGSDSWNIGTLAKGGSGQIQIQGSFNSVNPGEVKTATANFVILDASGQPKIQNSSVFSISISSLPLLVEQTLDPVNSDGVIKPGDNLVFRLRYQNNGSTAARGVNIVVTLDSRVVNLASLRAEGGQVNNNTILWNAATVPNLENLSPNESGQLTFSLQINNPAVKDSAKNLTLVSNIKIKSNEYESYFPGNQLTLKVSSPVSLSSTLSFVTGQLPPKVAAETVYKVKFSLSNSTNDYSGGVITAFVPLGPNAVITGSVTPSEASNFQYDSSTGKVTWNLGSLAANTGRFTSAKSLEFNIRLNPSSSQANRSLVLVKDIKFSAKDSFTNQETGVSHDNIMTSDVVGGNSYSNGTVLP